MSVKVLARVLDEHQVSSEWIAKNLAEYALSDRQLDEEFRFCIDETEPDIEVLGYCYEASEVLEMMDPTAFKDEKQAWLDEEIQSGRFLEVEGLIFDVEDLDGAIEKRQKELSAE